MIVSILIPCFCDCALRDLMLLDHLNLKYLIQIFNFYVFNKLITICYLVKSQYFTERVILVFYLIFTFYYHVSVPCRKLNVIFINVNNKLSWLFCNYICLA